MLSGGASDDFLGDVSIVFDYSKFSAFYKPKKASCAAPTLDYRIPMLSRKLLR